MPVVSIHQPAYIPWLGYFHKLSQSDIHVFYDDAEYSKNNLFNRNKIKTPQGEQWLTIPVGCHSTQKINQTKITPNTNWQKKHWKAIKGNYVRARNFAEYEDFFEKLYQKQWNYLSELTIEMNKALCKLLGIKTKFFVSSELDVKGKSNEKLINICKAVRADTYLSGKGAVDVLSNDSGKPYLDQAMFTKENIKVQVQEFIYPTYKQLWGEFIPNLSILDVLFNCGAFTRNYLVKE